jgi:anti-sigma regulatory factor (Ser/Thr protein kinase)
LSDSLKLQYVISDEDFTRAGEASGDVKSKLKMMGVNPEVIRKVSIAMYEGEINMVIHANGGVIDVIITTKDITMILKIRAPG